MWILLVEDEPRLAASIAAGLEEEGYSVDVAADVPDASARAQSHAYDLLVVDWRLPGGTGRDLVELLRDQGDQRPILMLTALADIEHRVAGLDAGADDYLAKPFAFEELLARLRALARRPAMPDSRQTITLGMLTVDRERRLAIIETDAERQVLNLRPKEFSILEVLATHPGVVVPRQKLKDRVWAEAPYVSDNAIDVTVSGLRQRLTDAAVAHQSIPQIETVRGVGYRLQSDS